MVEGARLESVYTGNRIEGSNPSVSAKQINAQPLAGFFVSGSVQSWLCKADEHKKSAHDGARRLFVFSPPAAGGRDHALCA